MRGGVLVVVLFALVACRSTEDVAEPPSSIAVAKTPPGVEPGAPEPPPSDLDLLSGARRLAARDQRTGEIVWISEVSSGSLRRVEFDGPFIRLQLQRGPTDDKEAWLEELVVDARGGATLSREVVAQLPPRSMGPNTPVSFFAGEARRVRLRENAVYDERTGELAWRLPTIDGAPPYLRRSPHIAADTDRYFLCVGSRSTGPTAVLAFRPGSDEPLWRTALDLPDHVLPEADFTLACGEGRVWFGAEGHVLALDPETGTIQRVWDVVRDLGVAPGPRTSKNGASFRVGFTFGARLALFVFHGRMYAVDPDRGDYLWSAEATAPASDVEVRLPRIVDGNVIDVLPWIDSLEGLKPERPPRRR